MEDKLIVDLYFERDPRALTETAAKYGGYCYRITHNILQSREDAEEALNDTYLAAWSSIPPHCPRILSTYLGKLARRIAIHRLQHAHAQKRGGGEPALALEELAGILSHKDTPEQVLEQRELTRILNGFLAKLPKSERAVFLCRYWYVDSVADIALRFGYSQSKVKSILLRTRRKLREELIQEGICL